MRHRAVVRSGGAEHATIRERLNSVDRRTARIEGHLFGIEIPADEADGQ